MAELVWDQTGDRIYETGVKKGVLYLKNSSGEYPVGVAWNGLVSVSENPSGAEPSPIYADDIKYGNIMSAEEFGATIEAYTYPDEFAACDGSSEISDGVVIGQQTRAIFGLAYQTSIGNDVDGLDHGYKLHLIYGGLASPSEKSYQTINDSPEAITFSWEVSTTGVPVTGKKPTALLTIESTKVDPAKLATLEGILFGTSNADARLPLPDEIAALFGSATPAALALSSISPAANANNSAKDTTIVLTFNNKISRESIVVTTAAGVIVAGTKSWNATGKILTFTPSAALAGSTVHLVAISGVMDIYGQSLAASVSKFTTVA